LIPAFTIRANILKTNSMSSSLADNPDFLKKEIRGISQQKKTQ
jgi:hypothetical protein